jgi:filamentous hemagglutinin family protein
MLKNYNPHFYKWLTILNCQFLWILGTPAIAQITPDTTLGTEASHVNPGKIIHIDGGAIRNHNLFHSFTEFNVKNSQSVYFVNPVGIENILSRVTGQNVSSILGKLGVDGEANLFLLNPNGLIFGENAQLDIRGSFIASTANSLQFDHQQEFSATNPQAPPLLTIKIPLGLQLGNPTSGNIINHGNLTVGKDLSLTANNLNLQGHLQAGNNLTLHAQDTLQIRDHPQQAFRAIAGGKMIIQGDTKIDIFALNHPASGFFSNGDMVLQSNHPVSGDGHFYSGANFRIAQNDTLGSLFSPSDPIILAVGDVSIGDYVGASLHILAGGSVQLGNVTINRIGNTPTTINPNNTNFIPGTNTTYNQLSPVSLSDSKTTLNIDGSNRPTLDIRAGIDWNQSPFSGIPAITNPVAFPVGTVNFVIPTLTAANIKVNNVRVTPPNGVVYLTNQYSANSSLTGDISFGSINTQNFIGSGSVFLNSSHNIYSNVTPFSSGQINTISSDGNAGNVNLIAKNTIDLNNGTSILSVSLGAGKAGDVNIQTGTLSLKNGSFITTTTVGQGTGGNLTINAFDTVEVIGTDDTGFRSTLASQTGGTGNAGNMTINTQRLIVKDGALITGESFDQGRGSDININATKFVTVNGLRSAIITEALGTGDSGNLTINTGKLTLTEGAAISTSTYTSGQGGALNINATDTVEIRGLSTDGKLRSRLMSQALGSGNSGGIKITTRNLMVGYGGFVSTNTFNQGNGGQLIVNASDTVELTGSNGQFATGLFSETSNASGNGGNLEITTNRLLIESGALASTSSFAGGKAGDLIVNALESTELIGTKTDQTGELTSSGLFSFTRGSNDAGDLTINTRQLLIKDGGQASAATTGSGNGGNLTANATGNVEIVGTAANGEFSSGLNTTTAFEGDAGLLTINTPKLVLRNGGQLSVSTFGEGKAGNLIVNATDSIELTGKSSVGRKFPSAILSQVFRDGIAGNIIINTNELDINNGATITVNSLGNRKAGDLQASVRFLRLDKQGRILAETASGDGGNITVNVQDLLLLRDNSLISATAGTQEAGGDGGNIMINAPNGFIVAFPNQNNDIVANAFQGKGGNININAQSIFGLEQRPSTPPNNTNDIDASSQFGLTGTIIINTPDIDPSRGLLQLPNNFTDVSQQIVSSCNPGSQARRSSFTVTGRGGIARSPIEPFQGELSTGRWITLETINEHQNSKISNENLPSSPQKIVEAQGWIIDKTGNVSLVAQVPNINPGGYVVNRFCSGE